MFKNSIISRGMNAGRERQQSDYRFRAVFYLSFVFSGKREGAVSNHIIRLASVYFQR